MAIWLKILSIGISLLIASLRSAQELVRVPVQIPSHFAGGDGFRGGAFRWIGIAADPARRTGTLCVYVAAKVRNELRVKG